MQTTDQVAGEAQMIADNLVHKAVCEWIRDDAPVAVRMTLRPEHLHALVRRIAALRAQPERGAEEMRERIEALSDGEHTLRYILEAWCERDYPTAEERAAASSYADNWLNKIAAIRALPLHSDKGEGGGR